jgi:methylenetetrahydrofolate dehydrogenase (NADP+) / methenyltetrahydrofolate cyclohydrolase
VEHPFRVDFFHSYRDRSGFVANILDGKQVAAEILEELKAEIASHGQSGIRLKLSIVLVGDNPASLSYVRGKQKMAGNLGIDSEIVRLPEAVSEEILLTEIDRLNQDESVDGILVQLPLPTHIAEQKVLEAVRPDKDVDGFHPLNAGRNFVGLSGVWPCTPAGIMELFRRRGVEVRGKHAVVVGRSNIVGRPMALMLLNADATVSVCHSKTQDLREMTRLADILVVAIGRPCAITEEYVKPGAVVVDVGINRVDGRIVGDVDFESVSKIASQITPVPGGVGPLTIAMLMKNVVTLGARRRGLGGHS